MSRPWLLINIVLLLLNTVVTCAAEDLERVRVSGDGKGFVLSESGKPFVPWGFNYDHEVC